MIHKKETPEPEHKKAAPKKVVKKKVSKPVSISHTLAPVTVVTTTEQTRPEPDMNEIRASYGLNKVEEEVKQSATGIWDKTKVLWGKYAWILVLALAATVIVLLFLELKHSKIVKSVKETQQTEQRIEDGKAGLARSEQNLQDLQHRRVDSNYRAALQSIFEQLKTASDQYEAYHAQMIERNEMYKKTNDALQEKIRTASDDSLLRIGRELSK